MTRVTATKKNPTSLKNADLSTLKGRMMHMEPTTQVTMNEAAPNSSPTARLPVLVLMAEKVENTSGLPFPNARNVTPATFSSSPRV